MTTLRPGRTEGTAIIPAGTTKHPDPSSHAAVFISYSRHDQPIAGKLRELLESEGWDVWWDQDLYAGAAWEEMRPHVLFTAARGRASRSGGCPSHMIFKNFGDSPTC